MLLHHCIYIYSRDKFALICRCRWICHNGTGCDVTAVLRRRAATSRFVCHHLEPGETASAANSTQVYETPAANQPQLSVLASLSLPSVIIALCITVVNPSKQRLPAKSTKQFSAYSKISTFCYFSTIQRAFSKFLSFNLLTYLTPVC